MVWIARLPGQQPFMKREKRLFHMPQISSFILGIKCLVPLAIKVNRLRRSLSGPTWPQTSWYNPTYHYPIFKSYLTIDSKNIELTMESIQASSSSVSETRNLSVLVNPLEVLDMICAIADRFSIK